MLEDWTPDSFALHVGTRFRVVLGPDDPDIELELVQVLPVPKSGVGSREEPFSLIFVGSDEWALRQGIFELRHDVLGTLEIFIVPIGPDPRTPGSTRLRYEAVFN